ncbi:hypothetical protein ACEZCY_31625 [Streptacidiphilus sp. N1-12]|uniref:Uncharacterized protein n=2 Tax=Streptacidiphilus alkalitolerans TaxID=3342712 RepID=A0ABV6WP39_9ACTN
MRSSAFLYPWDVLGDPDAPARLADLGLDGVTLASAYHSTRALTPRHPRTRIVTAPYAAVYYPPSEAHWAGAALRPYPQGWLDSPDAWGEAAEALRAAGLEVASWVVLAHNSRLGGENPDSTVRNAYGDRYPWALCVARPEVVAYCAALAAEAGPRPGAVGTELESCGWYGLAHLHAHDKIGGVPLDGAAQYLMSLCFCDVCAAAYAAAGVPDLAAAVRAALAPVWAGKAERVGGEWGGVEQLLGPELAALTLRYRQERARAVQGACVAAVRAAAGGVAGADFRILLHADPASHRVGANVGVEAEWLLGDVSTGGGGADGLVLPCTGSTATLDAAPRLAGRTLAANLTVVTGMGGDPHAAVPAGADELRLYHAGLASDADLAALRGRLRGAEVQTA